MSNVRVLTPAELAAARTPGDKPWLAARERQRDAFARGDAAGAGCLHLLDSDDLTSEDLPEDA
jgi:hypothetical protein